MPNGQHTRPSDDPAVMAVQSSNAIGNYWDPIFDLLTELPEGDQINYETLREKFGVADGTFKKHLKAFIHHYPELLYRIVGFFPGVDTIIHMVEAEIGSINGTNLWEANQVSAEIMGSISRPTHFEFLDSSLDEIAILEGDNLVVNREELYGFLFRQYTDFIHEADAGITSIVGRLNEEILLKGLENSTLSRGEGCDFDRTGNRSEGDMWVRGPRHQTLYGETKSYHARERFLRGLRDIPHPQKFGIGFFIDASEFNPSRTRTLLEAQPKAIYLPDHTFAELGDESRGMRTVEQNLVYRPLTHFVDDMIHYRNTGYLREHR